MEERLSSFKNSHEVCWSVCRQLLIPKMNGEGSRDRPYSPVGFHVKKDSFQAWQARFSVKGLACWRVLLLRCSLGVKTEHEEASSLDEVGGISVSDLTVEWKGPREEGPSVWERSRSWWWRWRTARRNKVRRKQTRSHYCCSGWRHWKWPHPRCLDTALNIVSWKRERIQICKKWQQYWERKILNTNDLQKVTDCAQAGAPLISMSQTLKLSSTMKSNPKSWKLW